MTMEGPRQTNQTQWTLLLCRFYRLIIRIAYETNIQ